jgi:hypothetical protein
MRRANLAASSSSTDAASYTTASVALRVGRLYLLSVTNSKAAAPDAVSSVTGGPTWSSVATVSFNSDGAPTQRLTVLSGVPTVDYSGTLVIAFGGTETGCCWSLDEFTDVETVTADGVVQSASGTADAGTSVTATLSAFRSSNNGTFMAAAKGSTGAWTVATGFTSLCDVDAATPAQSLATAARAANDTSIDPSWTGAIGAAVIGVEIAASGYLCQLSGVKRRLGIATTDLTSDEELLDFIADISADIMGRTGRRFARSPSAGTKTFLFDVGATGSRCLRIPAGIAEASLLEVATATGGSFTTVTASDWFLDPPEQERDYGWPATSIVIADVITGSVPYFYQGKRTVRVTMGLGFESIPADIDDIAANATVRAFQSKAAGTSDVTGFSEMGRPIYGRAYSLDAKLKLDWYKARAA